MNTQVSSSIPIIADVTFSKTNKGHRELETRSAGLSPRARQLLFMIDGNRSSVQLLKIFPERELAAYLSILEVGEFVHPLVCVTDPMPGKLNDDPQPNRLNALSAATAVDDFGRTRTRVLIGLLKLIGPAGEPFALRIINCNNATDLRRLLPAILSIVEVFGGPSQAHQFAQETLSS